MSKSKNSLPAAIPVALAFAMLAACGGGGESTVGTSAIKVRITDAPVESAQQVWLQVTGLAFKPEGAAPEIVQSFAPRAINLLEFQNGNTAVLLDNVPFTAGRYQWIRLLIAAERNVRDSYAMVNGAECELLVPSGAESGLKLNRGFTVPAAGSLALTLDFDLRQSLHAPPGQRSGTAGACTQGYLLRPTIRVVEDANVGAVAGTVSFAAGTPPANCLPKVYLYEGSVTPDDVEGSSATTPDVDPLTVVGVTIPAGGTSGSYKAAFIPAGSYTAAFTCGDDTDADETLGFVAPTGGASVTVQNNLISTVNFSVPAAPPPP